MEIIDTINNKTPLIELKNCTMEFPGVRALDDVSFTLMPGECHALVGENGAGKSTLSKCITGENHMTAGELYVKGEKINTDRYGIKESQARGIAIIHQEFTLMDDMTGLENIFIGRYKSKAGVFIDWKALNKRANEMLDYLQCEVNLSVPVKYLRTAEKQIVQLAKALLDSPDIIVFDELTAVLQEKDIQNIYRIINLLTQKGIGIIYISHRLNEVFDVCNAYTVLVDGRLNGNGQVVDINKDKLVEMMIGRELTKTYPPINEKLGDVILEVEHLSGKAFKDVNINVRAGEVVGIAGLLGAGKTELVQAIFGNYPVTSGTVYYKGEKLKHRKPFQTIKQGFGLVPDERRSLGLVTIFDIRENTILPSFKLFRKLGIFQNHAKETQAAYDINEKLNLKYHSLYQNVKKLSGGNQQKIVIAKWMLRDTEVFLLDEPTRGIDIGAKSEIYALIHKLAEQGKAVILVSPEMEELIGLCNKIYIMYEGQIMDQVEGDRKTQEVIINSLLGVNKDE